MLPPLRAGIVQRAPAQLPLVAATASGVPHPPVIVGLDGSLTAYGWAIVALDTRLRVIAAGCVCTEKDSKSKHIYVADQDGARLDQIARVLLDVLDQAKALSRFVMVAAEAPAGAQHANAAKALGQAYGITRSVCVARALVPITVQAHEVQTTLTGKRTGDKAAVAKAVTELTGFISSASTKPAREGESDAVAVAITASKTATADALRRAFA